MHVCRKLTLRLSFSWMYIAYISLLLVFFPSPLCWWIDKKREKNLVSLYMHAYFISLFMQKGGEKLLCMFISLLMHICLCLVYAFHWKSLLFIAMHELRESFLSLSLVHAYITPWVLSSSKRGRLLVKRPITLVLMMINSCSYSLLIILCLYCFSYWSRY